jgi:hypothetical protein
VRVGVGVVDDVRDAGDESVMALRRVMRLLFEVDAPNMKKVWVTTEA